MNFQDFVNKYNDFIQESGFIAPTQTQGAYKARQVSPNARKQRKINQKISKMSRRRNRGM